jgi:hypothetical protein
VPGLLLLQKPANRAKPADNYEGSSRHPVSNMLQIKSVMRMCNNTHAKGDAKFVGNLQVRCWRVGRCTSQESLDFDDVWITSAVCNWYKEVHLRFHCRSALIDTPGLEFDAVSYKLRSDVLVSAVGRSSNRLHHRVPRLHTCNVQSPRNKYIQQSACTEAQHCTLCSEQRTVVTTRWM